MDTVLGVPAAFVRLRALDGSSASSILVVARREGRRDHQAEQDPARPARCPVDHRRVRSPARRARCSFAARRCGG